MKIYKISQMIQEVLPDIEKQVPSKQRDEDDVMEEYAEDYYNSIAEVLREFKANKRKKNFRQPWTVIPFARVKKIWNDYATYGFVRDERGMQEIANKMIQNVHLLAANTYLTGHTMGDPTEYFEDFGLKKKDIKNFGWDYAVDETGQSRISDYGLDELEKLAIELTKTLNSTQQLLLVDRMFNIVHQRSDLPGMFIEGGTKSLDQLAGRPSEISDTTEASKMNWYKKSQVEREYPVAAVVVASGKIFEGRNHGEAIKKALDAGYAIKTKDGYLEDKDGNDMTFSGAIDLFRTNKGRLIDRFEASALGEAVGSENIPEKELDVK